MTVESPFLLIEILFPSTIHPLLKSAISTDSILANSRSIGIILYSLLFAYRVNQGKEG